ncbi:MAG: M13 family metallopeptidase, partial [Candidatus Eremiobacterota bacterium]
GLLLALTVALGVRADTTRDGGFDRSDLDPGVSPCVDFYQYANGGWMKKNPIPSDRPRWGTFNALYDRNQGILKAILEECAADSQAAPGSLERKLGDFYASGMDVAGLNAAGSKPLDELLGQIDRVQNAKDLQAAVARLHLAGVDAYFNFYSQQDYKDSRRVVGAASQGGLGLPDRDYYFRTDEASAKQREEYLHHVARTFELMGEPKDLAERHARQVMTLETKLAEASYDRVKLRDPDQTYHPMDRDRLARLTPGWDWPAYFQRLELAGLASINVETPEFFQRVDELAGAVPLDEHRAYLRWQLVSAMAPYLSEPFEEEDFRFNGRVLNGTPEQLPRWKRVVSATDRCLGEALGQKFVQRTFSPRAKARVQGMVDDIRATLAEQIAGLDWMSPQTREQALAKLQAFRCKIGYPDTWIDYGPVRVDRGPFASNVLRAREFAVRRDLAKIGQPVDPDEWYMTPPTVNAYYDPSNNEIVFPAGILQPPFFSENAPDALNYGGIGMVIGHEITHGFDDQGARFDGQGNLRDWWTPDDLQRFSALADRVADEYSGYTVEGGLKLNGKLVVGEAIADIGGLKLAYRAFQRGSAGRNQAPVDGFTPDQLFFLGYARIWAMNMRPEYVRLMVNTDPHPHPRWRVNGPLSSMPEFQEAFGCRAGQPMMRKESTRIW